MTPQAKQALKYVLNTNGNATVSSLDDDFEPIGPMLRNELMPYYLKENTDGKLTITEAGLDFLTNEII